MRRQQLTGGFDAALEHLHRGMSLLQAVRSRIIEPHCLASLADTHTDLGQYDQARAYAERALRSARNIDERLSEALALNALGRVNEHVGRHAEAMEHHRRAMEVTGDDHPSVKITALIGLANAARGLGDPEAASSAGQALRLARERSFHLLEGLALTSLADIALATGDRTEAVRHALLALDNHRDTGHRLGEAQTLHTLGEASDDTAAAYRRQSKELFQEIGTAHTVEGHRAHPEPTGGHPPESLVDGP